MRLDESIRGIDVGAKSETYRLIGEFAKEGMAVIVTSSEMPEILGMSDRIMVVHEGGSKKVYRQKRGYLSEHNESSY